MQLLCVLAVMNNNVTSLEILKAKDELSLLIILRSKNEMKEFVSVFTVN